MPCGIGENHNRCVTFPRSADSGFLPVVHPFRTRGFAAVASHHGEQPAKLLDLVSIVKAATST
jgi:hypothetical protein